MVTTAPPSDDELVKLADELSAAIKGTFGGFHHSVKPLLGTQWDQPVPAGVQNPYWEIVRRLPTRESWGGGAPEPDGHWVVDPPELMSKAYDAGLGRMNLCGRYAWSIPSPGAIKWIADLMGGRAASGVIRRGIVEIGAGSGYWAWQLTQAGVDVVAYDPVLPGETNKYVRHKRYHEVLDGDHSAAARYFDRALMLCWPPYDEPVAAAALRAYAGGMLIYIGEGEGGCCADDDFFALLNAEWEEIDSCTAHVTYSGIHCRLTAYRRR